MAASGKIKLVVIVGPTASGKSGLAMQIAKEFNGEIIAADSRTIYRDMDIGTAKPSVKDRQSIRHWGLDLVSPGENYSAARFKQYALDRIADIQKRGKLPILVGGTGLYIDGVIFDFEFMEGNASSSSLNEVSTEQLHNIIREQGYKMPINDQNRRHLIRTIDRAGRVGSRQPSPKEGTLLIGILPDDASLRASINSRAEQLFKDGVMKETRRLVRKYGAQAIMATGGIVYRICLDNTNRSEAERLNLFKTADWQYARRQKTWFKRNKFIQWFDTPEAALASVRRRLNT